MFTKKGEIQVLNFALFACRFKLNYRFTNFPVCLIFPSR